MHLTAEELIDLSEGRGTQPGTAHARSCEVCQEQLAGLKATMAVAADVGLPEPPPLFWDNLAARVRSGIEAEMPLARAQHGNIVSHDGARNGRGARPAVSWTTAAAVGVAAALLLAIYVTAPRTWYAPAPAAEEASLQPFGQADDPALGLVADLAQLVNVDALADTGWTGDGAGAGGIDRAVATLTNSERLELQRLLKEALEKRETS